MSIHVLTHHQATAESFSALLDESQQSYTLHDDLETLICLLPKLKKTDKVFYDLSLEPTLMAFDALCYGGRKTNLVAFERLNEGADHPDFTCPSSAKHYILLSPDLRKAGPRLKQLLHEIDASTVKAKRARKRARSQKQSKVTTTVASTEATQLTPVSGARYLTTQSAAMQDLLRKIEKEAQLPQHFFLVGEDGADFELAAREINYRSNGEPSPLHIVDPMRIEIDQIKQAACSKDRVNYCYLGLSYELGALSIERLNNYLDALEVKPDTTPSPCFILGHVFDSETYLEPAVHQLIGRFKRLGTPIELPAMADRSEDVGIIAQSIFTTLRTAHPFLAARTLSRCAIDYLEKNRSKLSYAALVRVIRNSIALTERDIITADELKSFGDDTPIGQHLVESLADEKFFKQQAEAIS